MSTKAVTAAVLDAATLTLTQGAAGSEGAFFLEKLTGMYQAWLDASGINYAMTRVQDREVKFSLGQHVPELEQETGVHRYVDRFDDGLRKTVFASVLYTNQEQAARPVRAYVKSPYTQVINLVTGEAVADVEHVLAGHFDIWKEAD